MMRSIHLISLQPAGALLLAPSHDRFILDARKISGYHNSLTQTELVVVIGLGSSRLLSGATFDDDRRNNHPVISTESEQLLAEATGASYTSNAFWPPFRATRRNNPSAC